MLPDDINSKYSVKPFPKVRNLISGAAEAGRKINLIHAFAEIDITGLRNKLRSSRSESGIDISFLAYFIYCVARTVSSKREFNSYKKGNRIISFDEVDISLIFEVNVGNEKVPMNYIIRNAGNKTSEKIEAEIRKVKSSPVEDSFLNKRIKAFSALPAFVRKMVWGYILRNPFRVRSYLGTVGITALHNINAGEFWGVPLSPLNLTLTLGAIYPKIMKEKDGFVEKEFISITGSINHDVIDGAEGKRLFKYIKDELESCYGK